VAALTDFFLAGLGIGLDMAIRWCHAYAHTPLMILLTGNLREAHQAARQADGSRESLFVGVFEKSDNVPAGCYRDPWRIGASGVSVRRASL